MRRRTRSTTSSSGVVVDDDDGWTSSLLGDEWYDGTLSSTTGLVLATDEGVATAAAVALERTAEARFSMVGQTKSTWLLAQAQKSRQ